MFMQNMTQSNPPIWIKANSLANDVADFMKARFENTPIHRLTIKEVYLLWHLYQLDGQSIKALAVRMGTSSPVVSHTIDRLEEKQLVTREGDPVDGRISLICMTPLAQTYCDRICTVHNLAEIHFMGSI
jgi:DNA-binding MarR family transcriptional regulator